MRSIPTGRAIQIACMSLLISSAAYAQSAAERYQSELARLRRETILEASRDIPAGQRAFIDYGGYFTFDYLTVDDSNNDTHTLRQYDLIAYTRLNFDGAHELFLRARATYRDFNPGDSFDGRGDELLDPDLDLGYYRFDLARYLSSTSGQETDGNVIFQVGRDIAYWGNGLVLGQVLDGVTVELSKGTVQLTGIAGVTPIRTVDFDASRPGFDYNTRRGFYGLMVSAQAGDHKPYAYALLQQDYNRDVSQTLGTVTTSYGYDSYYIGLGSTGNFGDHLAYGAELVYEGGDSRSNSFVVAGPFLTPVEQTIDSISAWAGDLRLDYLVQDLARTRISSEMLFATGDSDRLHTSNAFGGNTPGTSDDSFNGFGLINAGQAFAPVVSNLIMFRAGVSTYPFHNIRMLRQLQVGADVFVYAKFDEDAPIDELTEDGRFLGWEPDVYMNWQMTSDLTLALRYGAFFPNEDVFGDDEIRQFFSTSVTIAF